LQTKKIKGRLESNPVADNKIGESNLLPYFGVLNYRDWRLSNPKQIHEAFLSFAIAWLFLSIFKSTRFTVGKKDRCRRH
jgi:hypothetical protein